MSTGIIATKSYVAGWLDTTVHHFLEGMSPRGDSTRFALVTCIDSNRSLAAMLSDSPELQEIAQEAIAVGTGILIPTQTLLDLDARSRIFFGFDELWFFPHENIKPKPNDASLVGPARLSQPRFDQFSQWLDDNSCSLGIGGGEGLNFIVKAHGLVRFVLGHSISQPQPA